jgi:hypothetical protein
MAANGITIQLPPSAWSQMGINGHEGEHTASPPHSPMSFEKSKSESRLQRGLEKLWGRKFGPNDPAPSTPKDESKKRYSYDSPVARPTPRTTPHVSPQKTTGKQQASPMAPIDENGSTINFENLKVDSPIIRRPKAAPTPHHTPVTPEARVERVALGKFKGRSLFQKNSSSST